MISATDADRSDITSSSFAVTTLVVRPSLRLLTPRRKGVGPNGDGGAQKVWFSPPKTSLTEVSVTIRLIVSARRSEQERTTTLSGAPGGGATVSVTTICSKPVSASRSYAGPEKRPCVAAAYTRRAP